MQLKKIILQNSENIIKILEYYGYHNIVDRGKKTKHGITADSNPTSILISKDENLSTIDFARDIQGDIFTLIMEQKNLKFKEVVENIKNILGIEIVYNKEESEEIGDSVVSIFDDLIFNKEKEELQIYPESILDRYENVWNLKFFNDGISIETQKKFDIRYDNKTNRIVIPHRTQEGDICGIMGRANFKISERGNKYFPLIEHKKSQTLFGFSQNYENLYKADAIFIGESEKFVMQLDSMKYWNKNLKYFKALSLSGSNISREQCFMIASLLPKRVVFCFDEGLIDSAIYRVVNKFKLLTQQLNIRVYILKDKENKYLPFNSKASPTDFGIDTWVDLVENCIEKV